MTGTLKTAERKAGRPVILRQEDVHKGYLILVNASYPLKSENEERNPQISLKTVDNRYPDVRLEWKTCEMLRAAIEEAEKRQYMAQNHQYAAQSWQHTAQNWQARADAPHKSGADDADAGSIMAEQIVPVSGYRTLQEQKQIYDSSLAENGADFTRKYVALPGCSEHQTGLAIDLGKMAEEIDFIRPDFPDSGLCGAFQAVAASYGFIRRYAREKEHITGISWEPWHFRYVGRPHARLMEQFGWCLEEYIEQLRAYPYGRRHLQADSKTEVCYVKACGPQQQVQLPEDADAEISGNNADGFILTLTRR